MPGGRGGRQGRESAKSVNPWRARGSSTRHRKSPNARSSSQGPALRQPYVFASRRGAEELAEDGLRDATWGAKPLRPRRRPEGTGSTARNKNAPGEKPPP